MSAIARDWGTIEAMPVDTGFNADDRRRFERVDFTVEAILKKLEAVEKRFEDVEVDIDDLRGTKADKSEYSQQMLTDHETRLRIVESNQRDVKELLGGIRSDLEPLREWRWKQLGALGVVILLVEVIAHVVFK